MASRDSFTVVHPPQYGKPNNTHNFSDEQIAMARGAGFKLGANGDLYYQFYSLTPTRKNNKDFLGLVVIRKEEEEHFLVLFHGPGVKLFTGMGPHKTKYEHIKFFPCFVHAAGLVAYYHIVGQLTDTPMYK